MYVGLTGALKYLRKFWLNLGLTVVAATLASPALAAEQPPVSDYGDLPGVEQMALAPDGRTIAIVARIDGARNLVALDADRKLLASMPLADAKVREIVWGDSQHLVVIVSKTEDLGPGFRKEKMELFYAAVMATTGKKLQWVFSNSPSVFKYITGFSGIRNVGGNTLAFFEGQMTMVSDKTRMDPSAEVVGNTISRPALFSVDLATMKTTRVPLPPGAKEDSYDSRRDWMVGADGSVVATLATNTRSGNWRLLGIKGETLAKGNEPSGDVNLIALTNNASAIVYSVRESDDERHWYSVPRAGGAPTELLPDIGAEEIFVDRLTGEFLGYEPKSDDGQAVPVMFDPVQQDRVRKIFRAFAGRQITLKDFTPGMTAGLVRTSGNGDAGTWYTVDVVGRRADLVGEERPLIRPEAIGPISTVAYKAADGLEMVGVLTLPPGRTAKNLPVVMLPHGGPRSHDVAAFDWWAQALASRGYAVFQPNFRGSTDQDGAFLHAGDGQWGRKMQTDISDGLAELARRGIVDPKRACIVGGSYGGYAALAGVTLQKGIYRCAVALAPVSDLSQMVAADQSESGYDPTLGRNLKEMLGAFSTLDEVSPRKHAAEANAPIMLIHGKDDTVVPFSHSTRMASALRGAGKPVEMVVLPDEDHWLSRAATRKAMLEACVRFVMANNPPD